MQRQNYGGAVQISLSHRRACRDRYFRPYCRGASRITLIGMAAVLAAIQRLDVHALPAGLGEAEVAVRQHRVEVNAVEAKTSRSVIEILRANLFTRFNALLGGLLVVMLVVAY